MKTWSYSSISTFIQCPKKYHHLRVLKDVKDQGSAALVYGQQLHKAAEHYIKTDTPLPPDFSFVQKTLDAFNRIPGEKYCEIRLGLTIDYEPCKFFADDVWWRGIADLLIVDGKKGYLIDYKTGKNPQYADPKQLDMLAGAIFVHFPQIQKLKSALAYVVSNDLIKLEHVKKKQEKYLKTFDPELERLAGAEGSGVWNPVSGPLCKFCPVFTCEHNRR